MTTIDNIIKNWEGEAIISHYDNSTDTWMFVGVYSTSLGRPAGGTRMMNYKKLEDAIYDVMKLSEGMAKKFALANIPRGGGKAVLAIPQSFDNSLRVGLMERYGKWLAGLRGILETAGDIGTNVEDLKSISKYYDGVFGLPVDMGGGGDLNYPTALGVYASMVKCAEDILRTNSIKGLRVALQGLGGVGSELLKMLYTAGCEVVISDIREDLVRFYCEKFGFKSCSVNEIYEQECEIFSPCAIGGILNPENIARLNTKIVVGAANNQLADKSSKTLLSEKGIVYVPDFVVNSGAIIWAYSREEFKLSEEVSKGKVLSIADTVMDVVARSRAQNIDTSTVAEIMAVERLAKGKGK